MKKHLKRGLATLLTSAMLLSQTQIAVYAEGVGTEAVPTETAAPETAAPETQAPETAAPETAAPETQVPETAAPETAAPETQAPETAAPETAASETAATETRASETAATETAASEAQPTESPATEKQSADVTEAETKEQTEKETKAEKKKKIDTLKASADGITVTVKLSSKQKMEEGTTLSVSKVSAKKASSVQKKVKAAAQAGYREAASLESYRLVFKDSDGKEVQPAGSYTVVVTYKKAVDLKLNKDLQPEISIWQENGSKVNLLGSAELNGDARMTGFTVKADGTGLLTAVGVQNHVNSGSRITKGSIKSGLGSLLEYAAVAEEADAAVEPEAEEKAQLLTLDSEETEAKSLVPEMLGSASSLALTLANGRDSSSVKVINLYGAADGSLDSSLLKQVKSAGTTVINVVAAPNSASVTLPSFGGSADSVIYAVTAQNGKGGFVSFTGTVKTGGSVSGIVLAPAAEVVLDGSVTGAVYAKKISGGAVITAAQDSWADAVDEADETETEETETIDSETEELESEEIEETEETDETEGAETEEGSETVPESVEESTEDVTEEAASETVFDGLIEEETTEEVTEEAEEAVSEAEGILEDEDMGEAADLLLAAAPDAVQAVSLSISALDAGAEEAGTHLAGAAFRLTYEDLEGARQNVYFADGSDLLTASAEADLEAVIDLGVEESQNGEEKEETEVSAVSVRNPKLREVLAAKGSAELTLVPAVIPAGYALSARPAGGEKLTISAAKADENETDPLKIAFAGIESTANAFTYLYAQGSGLSVQAVDTEGDLLAGAQISISAAAADGTVTELFAAAETAQNGVDFVLGDDQWQTLLALWQIDAADAAQLNGRELIVTQTAPAGYAAQRAGGETAQQTVVIAVGTDGQISFNLPVTEPVTEGETETEEAAPAVPTAVTAAAPLSFTDYSDTAVITFAFKYADNKEAIAGASAKLLGTQVFANDEGQASIKVQIKQEQRAALVEGTSFRQTITDPAATGLKLSGSDTLTFMVGLDADGDLMVISPADPVFYFTRPAAVSNDTIKVTKYLYSNGAALTVNETSTRKYYVALCDADGNRLTVVKTIRIGKGASSRTSGSVTFTGKDGLQPKTTYYVREFTGSDGRTIVPESAAAAGSAGYYAVYTSGDTKNTGVLNNAVTTGSSLAGTAHTVAVGNNYTTQDVSGWATSSASFRVTKRYYNEEGRLTKYTGTFYFKIYDTDQQKYISTRAYALQMNNESSVTRKLTLLFPDPSRVRHLRIDETDANGNLLTSGSGYTVTYENQSITLTPSQADMPNTIIQNKVNGTKQTEAEDKLQATLTLTKRVTYKNTPTRVNAVYYIGIFDDPQLTKLRMKRPMTFRNASAVSADLTINLYKLSSQSVTFYFAEVDSSGNVVRDGSSAGYDISLNKSSITLNRNNLNDEVIVTNNIIAGSSTASALTNPNSGFAGDSGALAEAQALEADSNAGENTTTGDSSPILPLAIGLALSAAVICSLLILRRRRKHE